MVPTKFGIAFTLPFLNQGGALILVYTDGSVLLSHGGTEMGQGLHTKMLQVASRALEIPMDKIHISETATDKVPNTSPTAASSGSDINGMAVLVTLHSIKTTIHLPQNFYRKRARKSRNVYNPTRKRILKESGRTGSKQRISIELVYRRLVFTVLQV